MDDRFGQWLSMAAKTFKWDFDEECYNRGIRVTTSDLLINCNIQKERQSDV